MNLPIAGEIKKKRNLIHPREMKIYVHKKILCDCLQQFFLQQPKIGSNLSFNREMNGSTICSISIQQNTTWLHRRWIADAPIMNESQSLRLREQNQKQKKQGGLYFMIPYREQNQEQKKKWLYFMIPSIYGVLCVLITQSGPIHCDPMDCSHQTPLFMEFSRQEYWSGLPFPSPFMES